MGLTDVSTLLERCRQGDDLAWEALVRRYQGRVYSVAYHYMRNADEARDMAQEIFIRIYERLNTFQGGAGFLSWMLSLSRNACVDRLRRKAARATMYNQVLAGGEIPDLPQDFRMPGVGGSIVGGVVIMLLGAIILSHTAYDVPLDWLEDWWPAGLVLVGVYLLGKGILERTSARE